MHLVCLGVTRRMLTFMKEVPRLCKLSQQHCSCYQAILKILNEKNPQILPDSQDPLMN